jgi:sulfoxide reductase heme-binding subunit YedZ
MQDRTAPSPARPVIDRANAASWTLSSRGLQAISIGLTLCPAALLAGRFVIDGFGAEPIEAITHTSGDWGLRWLLTSLAITPARHWLGWRRIAPLRRTFGLAGFAYACIHLAIWVVLENELDPAALVEDLTERPWLMAGMASFGLLVPLAATSTRASMKRLGTRWVRIHRAVYAAAILAVVHHFWLIKADTAPAWVHATLLASLLGARMLWQVRQTS